MADGAGVFFYVLSYHVHESRPDLQIEPSDLFCGCGLVRLSDIEVGYGVDLLLGYSRFDGVSGCEAGVDDEEVAHVLNGVVRERPLERWLDYVVRFLYGSHVALHQEVESLVFLAVGGVGEAVLRVLVDEQHYLFRTDELFFHGLLLA